MNEKQALMDSLLLELRRGTITLSVLSQLSRPTYGYLLVQSLEAKGLAVEANTLYPLLRRLEKQELLSSEWETSGAKPRKYYILTPLGREIYIQLRTEWSNMIRSIEAIMKGGGKE